MVLSDSSILERLHLADDNPNRLRIEPFAIDSPKGVISYGLSSGGYDMRLGRKFRVFTDARSALVSPKNLPMEAFVEHESDTCIIPPHGFALGVSMERFRIPRDVIATCLGKSTYVRCGIIASVTPLEPEWEGVVTVEISNTSPCRAEVFAGEGILQVLFNLLDRPCERSYADKKGIYQGQEGITLPRVK